MIKVHLLWYNDRIVLSNLKLNICETIDSDSLEDAIQYVFEHEYKPTKYYDLRTESKTFDLQRGYDIFSDGSYEEI